jgi:ABC-2 type transport system ATP-binding protein
MSALTLTNLVKRYASSTFVLGPLNLEMAPGSSLALFGRNGAGKSTLFQLLTGHMSADEGKIQIFGETMHTGAFTLKRRIGYLPQNLELPRWVSAFDIITYALKLHGLQPLDRIRSETLAYWDSESYAKKPLGACSYGMQKRVALALATLHKPDLLILDEPFSGLDLYHIHSLENLLASRNAEQITIVSTHVAAHVARLCDRAVTIHNGNMTEIGTWGAAGVLERMDLMEEQFFPKQQR